MTSVVSPAAPAASTTGAAGHEPLTLKLWPDGPPGLRVPKSVATIERIESLGGLGDTRISDINDPTITVYRPEQPNGVAVIVAPGGAFVFLSQVFEGTQVCEWLNTLGITAVLLRYRAPTRDEREPFTMPVQDGQRALGLVRHHAEEWGLDPQRVGMLGFSAGANLAGHATWDRGPRTYPQRAEMDDPRGPDFLVYIYGGGFLAAESTSQFREDFRVPDDAPPTFFLVAHDDRTYPIEAALLYLEYKKRNLSAELHICAKGGHGFGMKRNNHPINDWPQRCAEWMASMGLLGEGRAVATKLHWG